MAPLAIAELVRATALELDDVVEVRPTRAGGPATYGPKRSVPGVAIDQGPDGSGHAIVHVVAHYGRPLQAVGSHVRTAVAAALDQAVTETAPWRVDVQIADVVGAEAEPSRAVGP